MKFTMANGGRLLGADECAKGLDRGWFTGAASKAIAGDSVFGVWATSWKPVDGHFTMAWNPESRAVGGEDVTTRYAPLENTTQSGSFVSVRAANRPAANAWRSRHGGRCLQELRQPASRGGPT